MRRSASARGMVARVSSVLLLCIAGAAGAATEFKLVPADNGAGDKFGFSAAMSGDIAVIGAPNQNNVGILAGAAYVYRVDGTSWNEEQKLTPSDAKALHIFAWSAGASGDAVVLGALDNTLDPGSAYVFRDNGTSWSQEQKLTGSDIVDGDRFGWSVAMSGDVVVVGARFDDDNGIDSGSAIVYRFDGATWNEEQKLLATDGAAGDEFGHSVAVDGDIVVVGALRDDDDGTDSGSAYVFGWNGVTWALEQELTSSDAAADDQFGVDVAISGDAVLVGAKFDDDNGGLSGSAYVFRDSGASWSQEQKLLASDGTGSDLFGAALDISGDSILVSSQLDGVVGNGSGSAYFFRNGPLGWTEEAKVVPSDGSAGDIFGASVALSGGAAVIGASQDGDDFSNSGSAYAFALIDCSDGIDNDDDGLVDFAGGVGDPGCKDDEWELGEAPQCNDGENNDPGQDAGIDFDGGAIASQGGALCMSAGTPLGCCTGLGTGCDGAPDPQCAGQPFKRKERSSCGLGFELVFVMTPILWWRRRPRTLRR